MNDWSHIIVSLKKFGIEFHLHFQLKTFINQLDDKSRIQFLVKTDFLKQTDFMEWRQFQKIKDLNE